MKKLLWIIPLLFFSFKLEARAPYPPGQLMIGAGVFDLIHDYTTAQTQIEYRTHGQFLTVRGLLGALLTKKVTTYAYFGLARDLYFFRHIVLTPSFAAGVYRRGHGKNMGYPIQFRSSLELVYETSNYWRFGMQFYHLSNASLSKLNRKKYFGRNPGEETLLAFFAIPL